MSKYEYDESLPFAIVGKLSEEVMGRMASKVLADCARDYLGVNDYFVVDTRPAPAFPDNAEVIIWCPSDKNIPFVAVRKLSYSRTWEISGSSGRWDDEVLLRMIGTKTVEVLKVSNG